MLFLYSLKDKVGNEDKKSIYGNFKKKNSWGYFFFLVSYCSNLMLFNEEIFLTGRQDFTLA